MAEVLFDLAHDAEAWAQLDALRQDRIASPAPYHLAAELLEERGDDQQALTWFNIAVSRLTDQEMAERETEFGYLSYADNIISGRRRVREALGLPADELDGSVSSAADRAAELARALTPPIPPREMRILFWPRAEIPRAHETWPQLVENLDTDTYATGREKENRELADSGIPRITMVPLTVAKLVEYAARTGGDPTDSETRQACIDEIVSEGKAISWPPPRNAPCWCGSATKYKKCCGRPTLG
ncbi:SEC-C domain-containing protein [Nocardia jinanensis]|nr:SEC-C domain-containing protein [Nocardia jinanensis]